jgi:hypothetical protein
MLYQASNYCLEQQVLSITSEEKGPDALATATLHGLELLAGNPMIDTAATSALAFPL